MNLKFTPTRFKGSSRIPLHQQEYEANKDDRKLEHGLLIWTHTAVNSSAGTSHEATGKVLNHVELGFLCCEVGLGI